MIAPATDGDVTMSDDRYEELTQRVAGDAATADALRQLWPLSNFATYSILQSQYTFRKSLTLQ